MYYIMTYPKAMINNVDERYKEYCKRNGIKVKPPNKIYITKIICTICNSELNSTSEERYYKSIKHQKNLKHSITEEYKQIVQALEATKL